MDDTDRRIQKLERRVDLLLQVLRRAQDPSFEVGGQNWNRILTDIQGDRRSLAVEVRAVLDTTDYGPERRDDD